ncbi:MAG: SPOR domain-containing protein [Salinivirgaceae bacterium]|nr:SPOR domain-containing protein [Salinivirgaceae bacterium]MDD4746364.1 SPOR domain-containing protein [Salinivirgaceae bacterium]MDY0280114.1 SPOR domain-containing protein [Salinivirgaceae bacterium]
MIKSLANKSNSTYKTIILVLLMGLAQTLSAQEIISNLAKESVNGSVVIVHQNESINNLLEKTLILNKAKQNKIPGYRIQLYSDYKSDARENALKLRAEFIENFPTFDSERLYTQFEPPFIKVRIGDYRDENSALIDYKRFVRKFPNCYIVKTTINYPSLGE